MNHTNKRKPDETPSCNSTDNQHNSKYVKRVWSSEEDAILTNAVNQTGAMNWKKLATLLPERTAKQICERWRNHLCSGIKKGMWTEEEDSKLLEAHSEIGNQWAKISKLIPGRSGNDTKNRFYVLQRLEKTSTNEDEFNNYFQDNDYKKGSSADSDKRISGSYPLLEMGDRFFSLHQNKCDDTMGRKKIKCFSSSVSSREGSNEGSLSSSSNPTVSSNNMSKSENHRFDHNFTAFFQDNYDFRESLEDFSNLDDFNYDIGF